jgi:hypothetical protein
MITMTLDLLVFQGKAIKKPDSPNVQEQFALYKHAINHFDDTFVLNTKACIDTLMDKLGKLHEILFPDQNFADVKFSREEIKQGLDDTLKRNG